MAYVVWKNWVICPFGAWGIAPEVSQYLKELSKRVRLVPLGDNGFKVIKK